MTVAVDAHTALQQQKDFSCQFEDLVSAGPMQMRAKIAQAALKGIREFLIFFP